MKYGLVDIEGGKKGVCIFLICKILRYLAIYNIVIKY